MPVLGYVLICLALVVATYTGAAAVVGHRTGSLRLAESSRFGVYTVFGLLISAIAVLEYLFATGDFSVKYVAHYSDRSMPLFYKLTALWGGQDGSLLFWVTVMSIWAAVAVYQNRNQNREIMPYTITAMMWVTLFFVTLLCFVANPFETFLGNAPSDGKGLNPLLQNPYMVTHPPSLYLGYIGWTIPFCFAMGALAHGKLDYGWIASMRRWCLVAWVFLSIGLTLGGLWAYEELGWGGYWAWDPVENAAFMPWLTGTAFIHSVQVQERRQMYKAWNLILIVITFVLTLLGTMMTRSGIVESVHAFAQSDIGVYFFGFLIVTAVVAIGLILARAKDLQPEHNLESILSREFAFLINNWVLLAAAFFVTFATVFPSIYKYATKKEINVGPQFFNLWMVPIGLMLLALTGVGPLLSWRKSTGATIRQQFVGPAAMMVLGTAAAWYWADVSYGKLAPTALLTFALCIFVFSTIVQEFWRGTRNRMKNSDENVLDALTTLVVRARRRYGGYVVHFGVLVMFLGFAGNAYKTDDEKTLHRGESAAIGHYNIRFDSLAFEDDGQKNMITAHLTVFDRKSGAELSQMAPAKWAYRKPEDQVTTEVDKRMTLGEDLYLVLGAYDGQKDSIVLQMKVNPLVNFVWLGCSFLMLGFAIAVWPDRRREAALVPSRRRAANLAIGTTTLALALAALLAAFS
jgi:cytochrome c-type biogenesis protein CcmF